MSLPLRAALVGLALLLAACGSGASRSAAGSRAGHPSTSVPAGGATTTAASGGAVPGAGTGASSPSSRPSTTTSRGSGGTRTVSSFGTPLSSSALQPGSDPSVLPSDLLIADRNNNRLIIVDPQGRIRWQFPRPGDLAPGTTFVVPDDAFFTADGKQIIATQEDDFVVTLIDVATHRIVWRYGTPGVHGMGPNQLWNPDDALVLPDGYVLTADIKNCRMLLVAPGSHTPYRIFGESTNVCLHDPPARFGSPNGVFPLSDGHYLVTEINGDWVDEMDLNGHIYWSVHPPGVAYPSDTNEVRPGLFVTVSYTSPGTLEEFDSSGRLVWRYAPLPGDPPLNQPSLAVPLPDGDVLMNDDYNHRVVAIDPRTDRIVWQYGRTHVPGSSPGYLDKPDGMDLAPPYSLIDRFADHIGLPAGGTGMTTSTTAGGAATSTTGAGG